MTPLVLFCLALLAGIVFADRSGISLPLVLAALGVYALAALVTLRRAAPAGVNRDQSGLRLALACGALFALGVWRYQAAQPSAADDLLPYRNKGALALRGVVSAPPDARDRVTHLIVAVSAVRDSGPWREAHATVLVQTQRFADLAYGDEIEAYGKLRDPPSGVDFSYKDYLARQGIASLMEYARVTRVAADKGNPVFAELYRFRDHARRTIEQSLSDPQALLLSGILLGEDHGIPRDTLAAFNRTGTTHVIAISGYNLALVAGFLASSGGLFLRRRRTWLFVLAGIGIYTVFVGASASVVRAAFMGLLLVLAPVFGRRSWAPNALAFAALVMALASPFVLWDIGFQLSFAATLGILGIATPLTDWLSNRIPQSAPAAPLLKGVIFSASVTFAATLAAQPLILYYFHNLSIVSMAVNLLVLPAQPAVIGLGALVVAGGLIAPSLAQVMGWLAWLPLTWTIGIVEWWGRLPFAAIEQIAVPSWAIVAYYVGLIAATFYLRQSADTRVQTRAGLGRNLWLAPLALLAVTSILVWSAAFSLPDKRLHLSFLDVGQGDATLIRTPSGNVVVIDGGPSPQSMSAALGRNLPYYQRDIALVVLTRATEEKLAGLVPLLERYTVARVIAPDSARNTTTLNRWRALLAQKQIPTTAASDGLQADLGDGVQLEIVRAGKEEEEVSLRLRYGAFSVYFDDDGEDPLAPESQALVLKVGRHGDPSSLGRGASGAEFLQALAPQIAVISAGANRSSGPATETLRRFDAAGVTIYRTDQHGTIEFSTDGQNVGVRTAR